ncbi:glucuronate isomerase [Clostridium sediminicola]|uniref:glucuronate isomerase n=1 Tax=Clostridium sediminicola TaxID=3114879 RepID=UPI0031F26CF2
MNKFMNENFLLNSNKAIELFKKYAEDMPIFDYHCHLDPKDIWEDKKFSNITEAWLYGDHYKWRAMRSNGITEDYITGNRTDFEKFEAWAKTMPYLIGNPLYSWTHLELQRYFNIQDILCEENAKAIWEKANEVLAKEDFSARGIIKRSKVIGICTTDDPTDTLEYHEKIATLNDFETKVLPTFRPDKALEINNPMFKDWVLKLSETCGRDIKSYDELLHELEERAKYFHERGCRLSDHSLGYVFHKEGTLSEIKEIFSKALNNEYIDVLEEEKYKTYTMNELGKIYSKLGWTMQLHLGAMRNNNTKMFNALGGDAGFDSNNDYAIAENLSKLLNSLDVCNCLPKTILYALNPKDNYVLGTMAGNFQGDGIPGKIQFGTAWWFNDNKDGMESQMKSLANVGVLGRFLGMLTDSRSFLSYTRHEYFRRILCNMIGEWVENGEFPDDNPTLERIIKGICFNNAKEYFGVEL